MSDRLYIECCCRSPEHLISFWRDGEDVGVNVQLSPYLPWWLRAFVALQYAFGKSPHCHWADTLLAPEDRARIAEFMRQ